MALSNPIDSTGTLEPDAADGMCFPFENNGLDTMWEFRLPHAANRIDYATLMDVVVSFDYLAFYSFDYQQTVMRQLKPQISTDLRFSLRNDFPDAWLDLTNPDLLNEPDRPRPERGRVREPGPRARAAGRAGDRRPDRHPLRAQLWGRDAALAGLSRPHHHRSPPEDGATSGVQDRPG